MEIVKKLNLNKTPKDLDNGSIICAKNMMVDDTGSFLTQDIGLAEEFVCDAGEHIVGVIPCSDAILIITNGVKPYNSLTGEVGRLFLKFDNSDVSQEVYTNWKYEGGTRITGAYTTNYKNELIIAIAESGAEHDVPLKSFIIHKSSATSPVEGIDDTYAYYTMPHQTYATEEEIPIYDSTYEVTYNGNLICGVYTFFVRFKIDEDNYTKWFQITGDINIVQHVLSKEYVHKFLDNDNVKISETNNAFNVNSDGDSNKRIAITFSTKNSCYTKFQLGYIIKRKSDVQARIQGEYVLNNDSFNIISIINNSYIEEADRDFMLESPSQYYNVENAITYNNRLYITNYKEYENEDYTDVAKKTIIGISDGTDIIPTEPPSHVVGTNYLYDFEFNIYQSVIRNPRYPWYDKTSINIPNIKVNKYHEVDGGYITDENIINKIIKYFTDSLKLRLAEDGTVIPFNDNDNVNMFWFIQDVNDASNAICLAEYIADETITRPTNLHFNFNKQEYTLKVDGDNIYAVSGDKEYNILTETASDYKSCIIAMWKNSDTVEYAIGNGFVMSYNNAEAYLRTNNDVLPGDIRLKLVNSVRRDYNTGDITEGEGISDGDGIITNANVNCRTLFPYQIYNFFIHYIRRDGSVTLGYNIGKKGFVLNKGNIIVPEITAIKPDNSDFVGYFISYEDVERTVDNVYITQNELSGQNANVIKLTNAAYLYDVDLLRGTIIKVDGVDYYIDKEDIKYIENRLAYKHVRINKTDTFSPTAVDTLCYLIRQTINQYKNETKTLYRLTKNIYDWDIPIKDQDYLPDFYNTQVIIEHEGADNLLFDSSSTYVMGYDVEQLDSASKTTYNISIHIPSMYSKYPTMAMNIKQDFVTAASVLQWKDETIQDVTRQTKTELVINSLISPSDIHDYLELQPAYRATPDKVYSNYKDRYINRFDKTVRRSDVVSDESLVNGFRHFEPNNYKNILENKGKITNIVGIGLYLLVHTEYSLFVFDRSPQLTQKYQMNIPDTFDIDYQEVLASNDGFGGLQDKDEAIVTKNGYIWYDKANNVIFLYVSGKAAILSADINNFIKNIGIKTVRFAEDTLHNRVLMCFTQKDDKQFTISFSFETKSFISLHDYVFTDNFRTYHKSYLLDKQSHDTKLFSFTNAPTLFAQYRDLTNDTNASTHFVKDINNCYVDIIFNEEFHISKVLNSISYVLNKINDFSKVYNIAEEDMDRRYSGFKIQIYTDETKSPILDITPRHDGSNIFVETITNYDKPVWDKGKWIFDYFRDTTMTNSDNYPMIFGKYFVVRFIFDKVNRVKLDTIEINTNVY